MKHSQNRVTHSSSGLLQDSKPILLGRQVERFSRNTIDTCSWHCQFSWVLDMTLTRVFFNSRWMAISTGFCEERVLIPHHTIFEEVVGEWFIHKASIGSFSCGMFCVGARRDFQNHLQQFGTAIQNVQLIFMRKFGLWKVPVRWHCISDFG